MAIEIQKLTPTETDRLRLLAAAMIPASAADGLPAADDPAIFQQILIEVAYDVAGVREALGLIEAVAGKSFDSMPAPQRTRIAEIFRARHPEVALRVAGVVVRAYYRDDRVMKAIGMEPRSPFPKGFEVEQGDWSLLDPVRKGPARYRPVT